jgi:hypothetical protein
VLKINNSKLLNLIHQESRVLLIVFNNQCKIKFNKLVLFKIQRLVFRNNLIIAKIKIIHLMKYKNNLRKLKKERN